MVKLLHSFKRLHGSATSSLSRPIQARALIDTAVPVQPADGDDQQAAWKRAANPVKMALEKKDPAL